MAQYSCRVFFWCHRTASWKLLVVGLGKSCEVVKLTLTCVRTYEYYTFPYVTICLSNYPVYMSLCRLTSFSFLLRPYGYLAKKLVHPGTTFIAECHPILFVERWNEDANIFLNQGWEFPWIRRMPGTESTPAAESGWVGPKIEMDGIGWILVCEVLRMNDLSWFDWIGFDFIWFDWWWFDLIWFHLFWFDLIWLMMMKKRQKKRRKKKKSICEFYRVKGTHGSISSPPGGTWEGKSGPGGLVLRKIRLNLFFATRKRVKPREKQRSPVKPRQTSTFLWIFLLFVCAFWERTKLGTSSPDLNFQHHKLQLAWPRGPRVWWHGAALGFLDTLPRNSKLNCKLQTWTLGTYDYCFLWWCALEYLWKHHFHSFLIMECFE